MVREELEIKEESFDMAQIESHIQEFVSYLHNHETPVVSFNYDSLLERIALHILEPQAVGLYDLYQAPVKYLGARRNSLYGKDEKNTFRLYKLHGSINWRYYSVNNNPGEQIYIIDPKKPNQQKNEEKDLVPVIVPPVLDKSNLFNQNSIIAQWIDTRNLMIAAEKIYIIGYSVPATDLTVKLMFQSFLNKKAEVFFINYNSNETDKSRWKELFGNQLNDKYIDSGFSKGFVQDLLKNNA